MESSLLSPVHPCPFDKIEAKDIEPAILKLVSAAESAIDSLLAETSSPTWDNTLGALEILTEPVDVTSSLVEHLESIATTPEIRSAYNNILPVTTAFYTGLLLNGPLFARLTTYAQ